MDFKPGLQRDILVSIRPFFATKILEGQKSVELRRRFPIQTGAGSRLLIYSSSPVSAVVGFARINNVLRLPITRIWRDHAAAACISRDEFDAYFSGLQYGFAIFLTGIESAGRRLSADDLHKRFGIVPPQSYRYLTQECAALLKNERIQASRRHKRDYRARRPSARSKVAR
jgi:predicted transcriptional regulator